MTENGWKEFALTHGMRACVLCGEPTGRGCPGCEKVVCWKCSVKIHVAISEGNREGKIAYRCKECATSLILSGQAELG